MSELKIDQRAAQLEQWARQQLMIQHGQWQPLAGDASLRRYFRLLHNEQSWIAVDAPNMSEDNTAFVQIAEALQACDVRSPKILAKDYSQGFLLLEDFGNELLSHFLSAERVDILYQQACDELIKMQKIKPQHFSEDYILPEYNRERLRLEMNLFHEWFLEKYLNYQLDAQEMGLLKSVYEYLENNALEQPQVFVHRDYHSRNIMMLASGELGIIDFQDAVWGPITYDLVSLLRDCYVKWPAEQVKIWALNYGKRVGLIDHVGEEQWLKWFNGMGLQRHIKVAGIFCRLFLRDGKSGYLADIPRVLQYIVEVASEDENLQDFVNWLQEKILPIFDRVISAKAEI